VVDGVRTPVEIKGKESASYWGRDLRKSFGGSQAQSDNKKSEGEKESKRGVSPEALQLALELTGGGTEENAPDVHYQGEKRCKTKTPIAPQKRGGRGMRSGQTAQKSHLLGATHRVINWKCVVGIYVGGTSGYGVDSLVCINMGKKVKKNQQTPTRAR